MNKLNKKGFTLIEVLAVITIIAILGLITIPSSLNTINNSTKTSYNILIKNITSAGIQLYEEIDYTDNTLYHYTQSGQTNDEISIEKDSNSNDTITVSLQTLVNNGLLSSSTNNTNNKTIINPQTKDDIGQCEIIITRIIDKDFNTSYKINNNNNSNTNCPSDEEYKKALN